MEYKFLVKCQHFFISGKMRLRMSVEDAHPSECFYGVQFVNPDFQHFIGVFSQGQQDGVLRQRERNFQQFPPIIGKTSGDHR